jgi:hypothetical protein
MSRHREAQPKEPSKSHILDHRGHHVAYRHSYDAASAPIFRCNILSRGASKRIQDPRAIPGQAWGKSRRIYTGSSSRRASRSYNQYLFKQREALNLLRPQRSGEGEKPCERLSISIWRRSS